MAPGFDHEKLRVYQDAIVFVAWCEEVSKRSEKRLAVLDQLERASTSIALNIAEGNGKFSIKDRCRFLDIARASALECAACLDVLVAKRYFVAQELESGKSQLHGIVSMLVGLINSLTNRVSEELEEYQ